MLRQRNLHLNGKHERGQHPSGALGRGLSEDGRLLNKAHQEPFSISKELAAPNMSDVLCKPPVWLLLAVASGTCAAFNGVFAKL